MSYHIAQLNLGERGLPFNSQRVADYDTSRRISRQLRELAYGVANYRATFRAGHATRDLEERCRAKMQTLAVVLTIARRHSRELRAQRED